jgi:multidrug efflux system membrane fusion protein
MYGRVHRAERWPEVEPDQSGKAERQPEPPVSHRETTPQQGRGRSKLGPLVGLFVAVLLGVGGYRLLGTLQVPQQHFARATQEPQPITEATVDRGDIRIVVNALGTVTPLATITVRTQINGQLTKVAFKEGQHVYKGDFLAQIDPRPYQAALDQAEGQLARDQGFLDQAQMDLARYQALAKTQAIPRQQVEDQVYIVKQYEGSVKTDQAQIAMQKLNLMYCHIVSPVDGLVGLRLVDPGNYVQTTDVTGLAVVTQLQPISIIFPIPEDDLPQVLDRLRSGATLEATVFDRANTNEIVTGKLYTTDNQIDTTTGTVRLRAEFDNADERLFPNQFVNVRLLENTLHDAVKVPISAVQRGAPGTYVYIVNPDGTVSVRPIKVGPTDGGVAAVDQGLSPGDRVVIDGIDRLRDGARVTIVRHGGQVGAAEQAQDQMQNHQSTPAQDQHPSGSAQ